VKSGLHQAIDLAKSENDTVFVRFHAENPGESPNRDPDDSNHGKNSRAKFTAREPRLERLLQALEKFI
jgi:hypothetical protein